MQCMKKPSFNNKSTFTNVWHEYWQVQDNETTESAKIAEIC